MFAAVMRVHSTGIITDTKIDLNLLSDERDMCAMSEATSMLATMIASRSMTSIATSVGVVPTKDNMQDWLLGNVGSYSHIGCSSKMGAVTDEDAVVDTSGKVIGYSQVWVCDASIFPDLPTGNTHLPVVMMAERISQRISESLLPS
jgi:choline dehydrogenase-like flavoprotein